MIIEANPEDEDTWFLIEDRETLTAFVKQFGHTATEDELYDWDRADLIELIFELSGLD